jgi:hypothetical protein
MSTELSIETQPEVREALSSIASLEQFAADFAVTTPAQYSAGAEDLQRVKSAAAKLEATRTGMTGPLNASLKRINDFFRAPAQRLLDIEKIIKRKLRDFSDAEDARRAEEQRKLNEKAERERLRLQAIADNAAAKGQEKKQETFETRAAAVVAPVVERQVPKIAGLSKRDNWTYDLLDESKLPREYTMPDHVKLRKFVKAMGKDAQKALGESCRVYNDPIMASGKASS